MNTLPICRNCKYWARQPTDPRNIGAPALGQCRGAPPQLLPIMTPQGPGCMAQYPILPEEFPACRLYDVGVLVNGRG